MVLTFAILAGLALTAHGQPAGEKPDKECCDTKTVGGVTYSLIGQMDTKMYNCLSDCIYMREGQEGSKFCFAMGDLQVECNDEEMEGSEKPPMEGSEKPPMEGSEKPPLEGSEKPPMEGSEKPTMEEGSSPAPGCKCGVKKTRRIVGGQETEVNEYPWMSALAFAVNGQFFCGGTLIGTQWVVTASHCLFRNSDGTDPLVAEDINIVLGEHDTDDDDESLIPRKSVNVIRIITHENYNAENSDNDVALLKLQEPVDINIYTPACVAQTGDTFIGQNAWVYGWGATSYGGIYPDKLQEVEVKIVSEDVCKIAMEGYEITEGMLCAGGVGGEDGCQGDSGGPLTVDMGGQHVLVGDVSWGNGCGLEGQYGVYAETAFYRGWIDENIQENGGIEDCPVEELDLTGIIDPKLVGHSN